MDCVQTSGNTELANSTVPESGVHLNGSTRPTTERRVYNFGTGLKRDASVPASPRASRTVPGVSFAATGFEIVDKDDVFVSWFACPLDACAAFKLRTSGTIVRCSDRAAIKNMKPTRGR